MQCINKVQQWFFNSFNNSCMLQNKWFGKMAERFKCLNILPLVFKYMQYCGIYIYDITYHSHFNDILSNTMIY